MNCTHVGMGYLLGTVKIGWIILNLNHLKSVVPRSLILTHTHTEGDVLGRGEPHRIWGIRRCGLLVVWLKKLHSYGWPMYRW